MSYWTVALFIVISIIICVFLYTHKDNMYTNVCGLQGRSQDFLKGGSSTSIELL